MKEKLEFLIQLQYVDSQLQELEEAKGDLPKEVGQLQEEKEDLETSIQQLEEGLNTAKSEHRECESVIALTTEHLKTRTSCMM